MNIHNAFHQGQYQTVADFDTSSFSENNALPARILQLRARTQLGQASEVITEVKKDASSSPDLAAVLCLAQYSQDPKDSKATEQAVELSKSKPDNLTVQLLCGTVLADAGMIEEALALLSKHQGSLDA